MKIWKYIEMEDKIKRDLDLEDETFISPNEMIGYFNEAITEAESEIMVLNQDYFLSKYFVPTVQGQQQYDLPHNIFANKIRGLMYLNGSIQYTVDQYRRKAKFEDIALTEQFGINDDYRYYLSNNDGTQMKLEVRPQSRETALFPPSSTSLFTPMVMWYIRNARRVPLVGEFCNPEVLFSTQFDTGSNSIQVSSGYAPYGNLSMRTKGPVAGSSKYVTGNKVRFYPLSGSTLPSGIVEGVDYYLIVSFSGTGSPSGYSYYVSVATSLQNARAGTAMVLGAAGTGVCYMVVEATRDIVANVLIDIPEFATFVMQWVKCRCMEKEGDPRLKDAADLLAQQKMQMVDTLTQGIVDDDDKIQADFSHYQDTT